VDPSLPLILGALTLCFLAGSIPFGFLIGKLNGRDLRREGSGNIGATNVWRVLGPRWGMPAFLLDFLKGFLPLLALNLWVPEAPAWLAVTGGLAAVLGHNFTPWLNFNGGKGIAVTAGVLGALMPWSLLISISSWGLTLAVTRTVSVASLVASVVLPLSTWIVYHDHPLLILFGVAAGALSIWRHRGNIKRLMRGEELAFTKKAPPYS
jgi:acyl phosphate:glycerol-3-phosphate acyltransferase